VDEYIDGICICFFMIYDLGWLWERRVLALSLYIPRVYSVIRCSTARGVLSSCFAYLIVVASEFDISACFQAV